MVADEKQFEISQYLDGDLTDAQRQRVEAELAADAEARRVLADYRRVDTWAKAAAPPLPGVDWPKLGARIMGRAAERQPRTIRVLWWTGAATAAAAAIVIATLVLLRTPSAPVGPHTGPTELALIVPERVDGVTIEVSFEQPVGEPHPEVTRPSPGGSILIDAPTFESAQPPDDAGIVIAMGEPTTDGVLINTGPETGEWDSISMDAPM